MQFLLALHGFLVVLCSARFLLSGSAFLLINSDYVLPPAQRLLQVLVEDVQKYNLVQVTNLLCPSCLFLCSCGLLESRSDGSIRSIRMQEPEVAVRTSILVWIRQLPSLIDARCQLQSDGGPGPPC